MPAQLVAMKTLGFSALRYLVPVGSNNPEGAQLAAELLAKFLRHLVDMSADERPGQTPPQL